MKKVFISHPYQGKRQNLEAIKHICKALVPYGVMPISPVLAFSFMNDHVAEERCKALEWCGEMVSMSDELWLCGAWESSEGCCEERNVALMEMIPIRVIDGWKDGSPIFRREPPKWWKV